MQSYEINTNVPFDEKRQNANIHFHLKDPSIMSNYGFFHHHSSSSNIEDFWMLAREINSEICIFIKITDREQGEINCIDTYFEQPYDFQSMIIEKGDFAPATAIAVQCTLYRILYSLKEQGIIDGWNWGDYI